jgi:serine/threonine protein kinase
MSAPTTVADFLQLGRQSNVLDAEKVRQYLAEWSAETPAHLADALVRDGVLTRFQAEQLLAGRRRSFLIGGKYKVLDRIGIGGMASIYLCEHATLRRPVAIKVLPDALAEDSTARERFRREARAAAALDHPNIIHAFDVGQDGTLAYLVMEYVEGINLQELVERRGRLEVARACHYVAQAALGLEHAHQAGLVHRDVKPANLLLDRGGTIKLLDLGLARFSNDEKDKLTQEHQHGAVLGTADYLAPEQAVDCSSVDIRADIYSLGASFYFLLTGRPPFAEGSVAEKLQWLQKRQPQPVRELRREVPEGVVAVVAKMMAKDPARRYQTPGDLVAALAPWIAEPPPLPSDDLMPSPVVNITRRPGSRATILLQQRTTELTRSTVVDTEKKPALRTSRRQQILLVGLGFLAVAGAVAGSLISPPHDAAPAPTTIAVVPSPTNSAATRPTVSAIDFAGGFRPADGLALNNGANVVNQRLRLTDGKKLERCSAFWRTPVSVQGFTSTFRFQLANNRGDGFTFTLQQGGPTAVGDVGRGLGYAGIGRSVAIQFNFFPRGSRIGLGTQGIVRCDIDLTKGGIDLYSGHEFEVHLVYDGTTLTTKISDLTTKATASYRWPVNIAEVLGSGRGYVGFTAGTGGETATQEILSWSYQSEK